MLEDGPILYVDQIRKMISGFEKLADLQSFDQIWEELQDIKIPTLSRKAQPNASEENKDKVKKIKNNAAADLKALREGFFADRMENIIRQQEYLAPFAAMMTRLIRDFSQRYQEEKRDRNIMDFSDLEHYALRLLVEFHTDGEGELTYTPTRLADELSAYYHEIVCDEYQDSNRIQDIILDALSSSRRGRHNRFMVGDVKQSIYRFRQADAGIFLEKYKSYAELDHCRRIDLGQNFRSRPHILEGVNEIFRRIMRREAGDIEYDEAASLKAGAAFPREGNYARDTDVMLIDFDENILGEDMSRLDLEAAAIAAKIRQITDPAKGLDVCTDDGQMRKAVYGDIAILLRSAAGRADAIASALTQRGIPAQAELSVGFFSAPEIMTMTALLSIVDNPRQDIPLAAVLHSPIGGMSSEELAMVRAGCGQGCLYDALLACRQESPAYENVSRFLQLLETLRDASDYLDIDELIDFAYDRTGYYDIAGAMPAGGRRKANLDLLRESAKNFMLTGMSGLFGFMRYLEQIRSNNIDFGEASYAGEGGSVRIMTIHKSKGLEFPVVILAQLDKEKNEMDSRSRMLVHPRWGIGLDAADPVKRRSAVSFYKKFIAEQIKEETAAEELRILYVAMTRAKEKLILTAACGGDMQEALEKWQNVDMDETGRMSPRQILGARSYLDLIMPCLFDMGAARRVEDDYNLPHKPGRGGEALFHVNVISTAALMEAEIKRTAGAKLDISSLLGQGKTKESASVAAALDRDQSWEYKWKEDLGIKGKYSVSELKEIPEDAVQLFESQRVEHVPAFLEDDKKSPEPFAPAGGAERGTAFHRVMELIDMGKAPDEGLAEWTRKQIRQLADSGRLEKRAAALVSPGRAAAFLASDLGLRMRRAAKAGKLHRESQFVMGVPAHLIDPQTKSSQLIVVQGIIDAWFEEEEGIVLLDYKTDRVDKEGGMQELVRRYGRQLKLYAYALEHAQGKNVIRKLIYSVHLGEVICLET